MLNIERLLKKGSWTGEELGRLEIALTMDVFKQSINGVAEPTFFISDAEFYRMLDTLDSTGEGRVYNAYIEIHKWFSTCYPYMVSNEYEAQVHTQTLREIISTALVEEDINAYVNKLPLIMTEKQYNDYRKKKEEELLADDITFNVFNLIQEGISHYIEQLHKAPRKKNPLKPLKEKLEKSLVKCPFILNSYCNVMGLGYYITEDGVRSDKATFEEWLEAMNAARDKALGKPAAEIKSRVDAINAYIEHWKTLYNNGESWDNDNISDFKKEFEEGKELLNVKFIQQETPPEDLTKWEILETDSLYEYYPALAGEGAKKDYIEQYKAFKKEFPAVVTAILSDLESYIPGVSKLKDEEIITTCYTWKDLYKMDLYGFKARYFDDIGIFDGNKRAIENGIAIVKPLALGSDCIDENTGYYTPPDVLPFINSLSLTKYFSDSENYAEEVAKLEKTKEKLYQALYFLKGYNIALDLLIFYYNIGEMEVAKADYSQQEAKVTALNAFIYGLYAKIARNSYEDKELKEKKLEVLKDVFTPFNLDLVQIPQDKIEKAKEGIKRLKKDYSALEGGLEDIRHILCTPDQTYKELEEALEAGGADNE